MGKDPKKPKGKGAKAKGRQAKGKEPKGAKGKPPKAKDAKGKQPKGKGKTTKDAQLVLRLNRAERDRFVAICKELDTSAAREIRRFMRRFVRRYERGELDD